MNDVQDIRDKAIEQTREELQESEDRDRFIVKIVKLLNELNQNMETEVERFRDLYSLHFPELEREITDDEEFMKILKKGVERDSIEAFESMAKDSTGSDLPERELELIKRSFRQLKDRRELRDELKGYIEEAAEDEMPNLTRVLGPLLAAKLLAHQGSLESLAKQPSSTIQMLGAEKALFRYLRGKGSPPKHGVLFEHQYVSKLPEEKRGKMARFLANKASIAARLDHYGDKEEGERLRKETQAKFEELKEQ